MSKLKQLLENNRRWSDDVKSREPDFFTELAKQQLPEYLWIGCSDSRVAANTNTADDTSTTPITVGSPFAGLPGNDVTHLSSA